MGVQCHPNIHQCHVNGSHCHANGGHCRANDGHCRANDGHCRANDGHCRANGGHCHANGGICHCNATLSSTGLAETEVQAPCSQYSEIGGEDEQPDIVGGHYHLITEGKGSLENRTLPSYHRRVPRKQAQVRLQL